MSAVKKINPVNDVVMVKKPNTDESVTDTGLVVIHGKPEAGSTMTAEVVEVGPEVVDIQPGDKVIFDFWAGTEYDGYIFLRAEVIEAVVA